MSTISLLFIPLLGLIVACSNSQHNIKDNAYILNKKSIALKFSILTLLVSIYIFIMFHFSSNHFQFVQNPSSVNCYNMSFGIDGSSVYFVLLTTITIPVSLLSNWTSITEKIKFFLAIILLLETLLLSIFLVLDGFLFYVFFESILPPLFILIGIFGSANRVKAGFYLFLYTLLGSLFMLLSILKTSSLAGYTQYDAVYKSNFIYYLQLFIFAGIFIAFAVKTPTIFLNNWLLKAHVESPLSGSIILAAIVLKLSLYGIFRLMLPLLAKACIVTTKLVYVIGFITIIYGSISTIRTIDVKELIAYSSVCHAAVYLMGVFSNVVTGIEGGIILGLAHGFVSSGLFICVGGVLYDRSSTRLISIYRGMAQVMPIFSILFFILCLGNCGVPLTFNFIGEFMSLYGVFERHLLFAPLASLSIILSAVYTIYLFNRIAFAGSYSKYFTVNIPDLNKREFYMLLTLVIFTVVFGIYPAPILDGIHYSATTLIYSGSQFLIMPVFNSYEFITNKCNYTGKKPLLVICFYILQCYLNKLYEILGWLLLSVNIPKPNKAITMCCQSKIKLNFNINNITKIFYKSFCILIIGTVLRDIFKDNFHINVLYEFQSMYCWLYFIIMATISLFLSLLIKKDYNKFKVNKGQCALFVLIGTLSLGLLALVRFMVPSHKIVVCSITYILFIIIGNSEIFLDNVLTVATKNSVLLPGNNFESNVLFSKTHNNSDISSRNTRTEKNVLYGKTRSETQDNLEQSSIWIEKIKRFPVELRAKIWHAISDNMMWDSHKQVDRSTINAIQGYKDMIQDAGKPRTNLRSVLTGVSKTYSGILKDLETLEIEKSRYQNVYGLKAGDDRFQEIFINAVNKVKYEDMVIRSPEHLKENVDKLKDTFMYKPRGSK